MCPTGQVRSQLHRLTVSSARSQDDVQQVRLGLSAGLLLEPLLPGVGRRPADSSNRWGQHRQPQGAGTRRSAVLQQGGETLSYLWGFWELIGRPTPSGPISSSADCQCEMISEHQEASEGDSQL